MDSSKIQDNNVTLDYWKKKWEEGDTSWHNSKVNRTIENYFDKMVGNEKEQRILFPLCGKTMDMKWVADKGHVVVGVEGSEKAAKEFFQDQNLEYKMDAISMAPNVAHVFSSLDEKIRIFVCNFFDFRSTVAGGKFNGVFDRGSVVAINSNERPKYAEMMGDLVLPGGKILTECVEYDPTLFGGPPHVVSEDDLREIYRGNFEVQKLGKEELKGPCLAKKHVDWLHRCAYLITRK